MRRIAALTIISCLPTMVLAAGSDYESSSLPVTAVKKATSSLDTSNLPAMPVSEIREASKAPIVSDSNDTQQFKRTVINVIPDVNEIITIATGHPNRITTPFDNPKIRTTSKASFDVEGRSIYVSSNAENRPVTAFVSDASNPDVSISLTFVPKRIPPASVELRLSGKGAGDSMFYRSNSRAKSWEESQPYLNTVRDLLRSVALNETPQGYTLSEVPAMSSFSGCKQSGLSFNFTEGQEIKGQHLIVNVGIVQNLSDQIIEFREPSCAGQNVKAVAAWPNPLLRPGQQTEVYVVSGLESPSKVRQNVRRSLLAE